MDVLVEDLVGVIGTLAPSGAPAVVVGESFGGAIALSLALAHPELVAALVVLNSFPRFLPQTRLRLAIAALRLIRGRLCPWCGASRRSGCTPGSRTARRFTVSSS
jgi:pimeloyl-ACP methyl ester carboxylesterase